MRIWSCFILSFIVEKIVIFTCTERDCQAGPTFQIRGIRSWKDEKRLISNNYNREIRVEGVRLLVLEHESFKRIFDGRRQQMSGDLVWLRLWTPSFSFSRFLRSMSLRRLRVLEIHGSGHLDVSTSW